MTVSALFPPHHYFVIPGSTTPAAGYQLFAYQAGTSTKENTFTDSGGGTPNSNPIVLDADGTPPNGIFGTDGTAYKLVLAPSTDTDPPASGVTLADNFSTVDTLGSTLASDLADTSLDDGTKGFNLVHYPLSVAEQSLSITPTKYQYKWGNVLRYGATGDGSTNDYTAIQNAINVCSEKVGGTTLVPSAKEVVLPYTQDGYSIETPLNLSNDEGEANRRGIRILGETSSSGDFTYGTRIIGKTNGKAAIEIIDNDNFQLVNLTIENAATSASTVGVYQARRTGGLNPSSWTGNCLYSNVTIKFTNDTTTQNSNFGTIGFLNIAGEETLYDRCEVWCNSPLIISWANTVLKSVNALTASTYDSFSYNPTHATQADITAGFSSTVYRTNNCRFIAKGYNAPVVLLYEIGSYHSFGDFTQKRTSTSATDGTNGIGYEAWNAYHMDITATTESVKTPMLFHRALGGLVANIRGTEGSVGQAKGIIHFGIDAPSFVFQNADVKVDYVGTISDGFITYTTPSGVGAEEPAQVTVRNSNFYINQTFANATIDDKIVYKSIDTNYRFSDHSFWASERQLRIPIVSKSIGTPATTTDFINIVLPSSIASTSGFSCTVNAHLHVSNAESEAAGDPSSCHLDGQWAIVRNHTPTAITATNQTVNTLTASGNAAANDITDLTLSETATGTTSILLKVASVQSGANSATAYITGHVDVIYSGGYSRAPLITLS